MNNYLLKASRDFFIKNNKRTPHIIMEFVSNFSFLFAFYLPFLLY
ncbi:hypothetical protein KIS1582_1823 [Cytobacillus firmus]|uniref:Uncharacterized protein n=1 Tax=Cytobacillus firmus TaxID=1399 RepID=A0A800MXH4_CYTFI|nr:hypothetical protein KIS1582_1823 [Cytobacillus firmus]